MRVWYKCSRCGYTAEASSWLWRCPRCGNPLDIVIDGLKLTLSERRGFMEVYQRNTCQATG
ncbi:hypothetical protein [Vulcanisaeta distributa]|uniref:hypothetical protein n=1 Tax=Vulcanisaeta distributa TaxID=164451 RepID=UPI001FB1B7F9|nr:hypothetical protein [Vulcanisaeta distributa]